MALVSVHTRGAPHTPPPVKQLGDSRAAQVLKRFGRSALRNVDVLGDSFRYDPTRFNRSFLGGLVTIACVVAVVGIIAACSFQFVTSPRLFMPVDRAVVLNSLAFNLPPGANASSRIALSDVCDLPSITYTLKITGKHYETSPTQIRRVTVTDRRKFGLRTADADVVMSSSPVPSAPTLALSSTVAVPLGAFNDLTQASPLDTSFTVASALASQASRQAESQARALPPPATACCFSIEPSCPCPSPPPHLPCRLWLIWRG